MPNPKMVDKATMMGRDMFVEERAELNGRIADFRNTIHNNNNLIATHERMLKELMKAKELLCQELRVLRTRHKD